METTEDDEDREEIEHHLAIAKRLVSLLPIAFPAVEDLLERTVLRHDDLSLKKILVDGEGVIIAVLDWEFVSAMSYWFTTETPQFSMGPTSKEEPLRDDYADETQEEAEEYHRQRGKMTFISTMRERVNSIGFISWNTSRRN